MKNVIMEKSKDGYFIVKVNIDGKFKYIGSKYNMASYLDKFKETIQDSDNDTIFVIFGIGSGEHIKEIRKKSAKSKVFIFEPSKDLVEYYKGGEEFEWMRKDDKIKVAEYSTENFNFMIRSFIIDEESKKIKSYPCFSYDSLYKEEYLEFLKNSKNIKIEKRLNINTKILFSDEWFGHFIKNLKYICEGRSINEFIDKYKNKPAIIVSAGPSLDENLKYIEELNDEMFIFCGGRNLKSFSQRKITPHLVSVVDAGKVSYNIVKDYIKDCKAPLLFYEGSNSDAVREHGGDKIFYTQSRLILDVFEGNIKGIGSGGSVAHIITKFAAEMGCNPIIFIGQDLAFTDGKLHADSVKTRDSSKDINQRTAQIDVTRFGGKGMVKTDNIFNVFRKQLETIISTYPQTKFINCSVGGARIEGTEEMILKDAIEKYKSKVEKIVVEPSVDKEEKIKKFNDILNNGKNKAEDIVGFCKKGLKKSEELKSSYLVNNLSKFNKVFNELNGIDREISRIYNENEILKDILYPVILWGNEQQYCNEKDYNSKLEYINEQKRRKDELYNKLLKKCGYILEKINDNPLSSEV